MSLIAPHEWGQHKHGEFLARCRLRTDMTWEMEMSALDENSSALAMARSFVKEFVDAIAQQRSICDNLPFYVSELPYYQRMLATALASSLQRSLPKTGDNIKALLSERALLSL